MIPDLSESTLNALVMGCDASKEYGPVVRTLVAALRSESERASQLADALAALVDVLADDGLSSLDKQAWFDALFDATTEARSVLGVVSSTQPEPVSVHVQRDDGPDDTYLVRRESVSSRAAKEER